LKKRSAKEGGKGKADSHSFGQRESPRQRKASYSSVAVLNGSEKYPMPKDGSGGVWMVLALLGFAAWNLGSWLYFQAVNEASWLFYLVYFIGDFLAALIFLHGFHHRHDIVHPVIQASTMTPVQARAVLFFLWMMVGGMAVFSVLRTVDGLKIETQRAPGEVTRVIYHRGFRSGYYRVEARFTAQDGKTRTLECKGGAPGFLGFLLPDPGDKVEVLYNPNVPTEVWINQFGALWSVPLYAGIFWTLLTVVLFRIFRKVWGPFRNGMKKSAGPELHF
jgi:hypothetical protein